MKSKKLNVTDSVEVRDNVPAQPNPAPAVGIITLYDNTGKVVRKVHNTIVKSGREFLFSRFLSASGIDGTNTIANESSSEIATSISSRSAEKFGKIYFIFEATPSMTTPDMTINDISVTDENKKSYNITSGSISKEDLKFSISQSVSASASFMKFNEIYITTVSSDNNTETLFSRALIDPLYIGEDTVYDLEYSFYF
jgi:hypothetical protein